MKMNKIFLMFLLLQSYFCQASSKEDPFNELRLFPVHQAVFDNQIERTKELLESDRKNINTKNKKGDTALHIAVRYNRAEIVDLLLKKGAEVNSGDSQGKTPLHHATTLDSHDILAKLLLHEADRFLKDKEGRTALHYAAQKGKHFHISSLLGLLNEKEKQSYLNEQDSQESTALHLAAQTKSYNAIQTLLINGVNGKIKNRSGKKAWSLIPRKERLAACKAKKWKKFFDNFRWASHGSLENFIYRNIREKRRYPLHENH